MRSPRLPFASGLKCLGLLAVLTTAFTSTLASSDGWTPIIPEGASSSGSMSVSGRHGPSVDLGQFHSHVDHAIHVSHSYRPHRPPPPPDFGSLHGDHPDTCALYKAGMTQDLYFQYIQYKVHMPDLKEFTLCMWHKFYNHSSDHPLFSYAIRDTPRAILSWVSSTDRSTYFSMAVDGHTLYRLNYPLRLNRWYHSCQSWNGRTGEWQVWINAERVGRGFHNLLVKHVIKGGGVAITGQEQRQYGGGFLEGEGAPKGAGGMLGEITQLQMYSVALTAGKAYRDHKHHHGNYNSDGSHGSPTTTAAPAPETTTVNPYAPFLTNGQLTPQLPIFELSAFRKNVPMPMDPAPAQDPASHSVLDLSHLLHQGPSSGAVSYLHMSPSGGGAPVRIPLLSHPRPALDLDDLRQQHYVFKRDDKPKGLDEKGAPSPLEESAEEKTQGKREVSSDKSDAAKADAATADADKTKAEDSKKITKREAVEEPKKDNSETVEESKEISEVFEESKKLKREAHDDDIKKLPATEDAANKRESKRIKSSRQRSRGSPKRKAPEPEVKDSGDVKESTQAKRETGIRDDGASSDKRKRQTISLSGGAIDLGNGEIDTSLLTRGLSHGSSLSGLLSHGDPLVSSYSSLSHPGGSPLTSYVEFHSNHQQLLPGPSGKLQDKPQPPPLKKETEPAEGEVMAVMAMCSGCTPDPFAKVNIISWQGTPKKLYSGVLYLKAKPVCRKF